VSYSTAYSNAFDAVVPTPTPTGTWPYATVDELAATLRIRVTPATVDGLQRALETAATMCDQFMDRPDDQPLPDPPPAGVVATNILWAVDVYKSADAVIGLLGFEQTGTGTLSAGTVARGEAWLVPFKINWAVA